MTLSNLKKKQTPKINSAVRYDTGLKSVKIGNNFCWLAVSFLTCCPSFDIKDLMEILARVRETTGGIQMERMAWHLLMTSCP